MPLHPLLHGTNRDLALVRLCIDLRAFLSINVNIVWILHNYEPCKIVIVIEQLVKIYDCRVCILITIYLKLQFVYQLENVILELVKI